MKARRISHVDFPPETGATVRLRPEDMTVAQLKEEIARRRKTHVMDDHSREKRGRKVIIAQNDYQSRLLENLTTALDERLYGRPLMMRCRFCQELITPTAADVSKDLMSVECQKCRYTAEEIADRQREERRKFNADILASIREKQPAIE